MSHDPNDNVRYPLTWPFWLAEKVAEAANDRAMSVATWLREAAIEKLERTGGGRPDLITPAVAADLLGKTKVRLSDWDTRTEPKR